MTKHSLDRTTGTDALLASREQVYGDRVDNMKRTAQMWSGYLGVEIKPHDVPAMMAMYKMFRMGVTPDYSDNIDDVDGWMAMVREVIGDDLIQARTVEEYLEKKNTRLRVITGEDASPAEDAEFRDFRQDTDPAGDLHPSMSAYEFLQSRLKQEGEAMDEFSRRRLERQIERTRPSRHPYEALQRQHDLEGDGDDPTQQ